MKRQRKKYEKPLRPWDKQRIERERALIKTYGLKNKKEIWRTESFLRKYRRMARELAAKRNEQVEKVIIEKLTKLGLLAENSTLDDVLGLTLENLLDRRLQTIVWKKGLTNTVKQARQFITHGNVLIGNRRVVYPSYLVSREEENQIQVRIMPTNKKAVPSGS